jgi:hypothetical protein
MGLAAKVDSMTWDEDFLRWHQLAKRISHGILEA